MTNDDDEGDDRDDENDYGCDDYDLDHDDDNIMIKCIHTVKHT